MRLAILVSFFALLVLGTTATADIVGSAHDFSTTGWAQGEICKPCHTPHFALQGDTYEFANHILWNHEITQAQFTMFDGTVGPITSLSKLCLSCHDGTVAMDNYGGTTNGTAQIATRANLGTDLRDDHPVAVAYNENWHAPASDLQYAELWDNNGTLFIECSSCHEPHRRGGNPFMLRVANNGSQLCLDCHRGK